MATTHRFLISSVLFLFISSMCCFCCFKRADAEMDWIAGLGLPGAPTTQAQAEGLCVCGGEAQGWDLGGGVGENGPNST